MKTSELKEAVEAAEFWRERAQYWEQEANQLKLERDEILRMYNEMIDHSPCLKGIIAI